MTAKKRVAAFAVAIIFLTVMLFSAFFVAVEANHECSGTECRICCSITVCLNTLSRLSLGAVAAASFAALTYMTLCAVKLYCKACMSLTLILLKVKLSN